MSTLRVNTITTESGTTTVSVNNLVGLETQFSHRNKLINGGFDVWQRGTSFSAGVVGYNADRWKIRSSQIAVSRISYTSVQTDIPEVFIRLTYGALSGSVSDDVDQRIEYGASLFGGKTVTLSLQCWVGTIANTDLVIEFYDSLGVKRASSTAQTITQDRTIRYAFTIDIPSLTDLAYDDWLEVRIRPTTNIIDGCTFDLGEVQLEEGSVATPFEHRPIGLELSLCQRYYETGFLYRSGVIVTTTAGLESTRYAVEKRVTATVTTVFTAGLNFTGVAVQNGKGQFNHYPTGGTSNSQGRYAMTWYSDAEL